MRFTSPHPKDFPPDLLEAVAHHPKICKHIHLPLQAGHARILQLMNRTYTQRDYLELVGEIRQRCPGIALTTDVICGFCSETEDEFLETYRVMEHVQFESAFIFKYSERKHTIAARKYPDDVPEDVKARRVTQLVELQRGVSLHHHRESIGHSLQVLVEGDAKRSTEQWMGRTDGNVPVIWPKVSQSVRPGDLISIRIADASSTALFGQPLLG